MTQLSTAAKRLALIVLTTPLLLVSALAGLLALPYLIEAVLARVNPHPDDT